MRTFLSQFRFSLLHGGHDHITDTGGGESVQARTDAFDRDDVEVSGAGVVGAGHDCSAVGKGFVLALLLVFPVMGW